jgi:hypothetical protein
MYNGHVLKEAWPETVYCPVSFNSNGKMIIDTNINNVILRDYISNELYYLTASSMQSVNVSDIYNGSITTPLKDHADSKGQSYDSSYQLYVATLSTTPVTLNHVSTIELINNHWTASSY